MSTTTLERATGADGVTFRVGQPPSVPATPPVVRGHGAAVRRFVIETTGAVVAVVGIIAVATTAPLL